MVSGVGRFASGPWDEGVVGKEKREVIRDWVDERVRVRR